MEPPFNLKRGWGWGYGFSELKYFFRFAGQQIFFFCPFRRQFFFLNQICRQIFFSKKNKPIDPLPHPLQVRWMYPYSPWIEQGHESDTDQRMIISSVWDLIQWTSWLGWVPCESMVATIKYMYWRYLHCHWFICANI